jgi:hypothetical protein
MGDLEKETQKLHSSGQNETTKGFQPPTVMNLISPPPSSEVVASYAEHIASRGCLGVEDN